MARIVGCVGASGKIRDLAQSVTGRPTASSGATYGQLWISDEQHNLRFARTRHGSYRMILSPREGEKGVVFSPKSRDPKKSFDMG